MAINNYETGHKFGPYELNYDEKSSIEYSKAIKNRDINFHSPFYLISSSFGILLEEIDLEEVINALKEMAHEDEVEEDAHEDELDETDSDSNSGSYAYSDSDSYSYYYSYYYPYSYS